MLNRGPMFKVGDKVEWESQAAGYKTRKEGTVYEIIPAGASARDEYRAWAGSHNKYRIMFDGWPRNHESYLVEVPAHYKEKPKLYWPRVVVLKRLPTVRAREVA